LKLTSLSVTDFLAALRSPLPTPGGGSAAALAGAMGSALLAMVAALPKSRAATEEDAGRLKAAGEWCATLSAELEGLVDRDSEAYDLVVAAYKRPKTTDEEKAARSVAIQAALREAIAAPLNVMQGCAEAAGQGGVVAELGNASASSDVRAGFELLGAGLRGARLNVEINLDSVTDQDYVFGIRREVERLESEFSRLQGVA
jgi:formiminotetrahydrofolate cyclodeaminase